MQQHTDKILIFITKESKSSMGKNAPLGQRVHHYLHFVSNFESNGTCLDSL